MDAQNYQNAGNAVLECATSTRDLRGNESRVRSTFDSGQKWRISSPRAHVLPPQLRVASELAV